MNKLIYINCKFFYQLLSSNDTNLQVNPYTIFMFTQEPLFLRDVVIGNINQL